MNVFCIVGTCLRFQALDEALDQRLQLTNLHQVYVIKLKDLNLLRYHVRMLLVSVRMIFKDNSQQRDARHSQLTVMTVEPQ